MAYRFAPLIIDPATENRFWAKVDVGRHDECWPFVGRARAKEGYGIFAVGGRARRANRVAWAIANGADPDGFVCHSCDNPRCCNPAHLWVGDNRENQADASGKGRQRGQSRTHCSNGHQFTPENTYYRPGTVGARQCRECNREAARRYKSSKRAA